VFSIGNLPFNGGLPPTPFSAQSTVDPDCDSHLGFGSADFTRTLRTMEEFDEVCAAWEPAPNDPDSDPRVNMAIVSSRPEFVRPHVIVVYSGGHPCSMLLGRLERTRLDLRIGYFRIRPQATRYAFEHGGPRGDGSESVCRLLIQELCRSLKSGEADLATLGSKRSGSPFYGLVRQIPGLLMRDIVRQEQVHHYLALPHSSEEFYSSLGAKRRGQIRRQQRQLYGAFPGTVSVNTYSSESEIDEVAPRLESVASKSYLRALDVGFRDTPEMRFQLRLAAKHGWLRIFLLQVAGNPVAFWICELDRGILRSCYLGYDPELGKHSPGMFLITSVIEQFCSGAGEQAGAVDFGLGDAQYKLVLAKSSWSDGNPFVFAPSFRGLWLKLIVTGATAVEILARALLSRAGALSKIRKRWREIARKSSTVSLPNARSGQSGKSGEGGSGDADDPKHMQSR